MKLTEAQHKQLLQHIAAKWAAPVACSICRANDWEVPTALYELREFHGGSMVIGGSSLVPVTPVTCKNCGNTVLINPLVAGVKLREEGK